MRPPPPPPLPPPSEPQPWHCFNSLCQYLFLFSTSLFLLLILSLFFSFSLILPLFLSLSSLSLTFFSNFLALHFSPHPSFLLLFFARYVISSSFSLFIIPFLCFPFFLLPRYSLIFLSFLSFPLSPFYGPPFLPPPFSLHSTSKSLLAGIFPPLVPANCNKGRNFRLVAQ